MRVIGSPTYVSGYIQSAYFELNLEGEEEEEFKLLPTKEKIRYLRENGDLIIDDFELNDIGEITEIEITDGDDL